MHVWMHAGGSAREAGGGSSRSTEPRWGTADPGRGGRPRGGGPGHGLPVINGSLRVSEATRAAVEAAVAELGYVPNTAARALAANRTDAIALVRSEEHTS